MRRIVGLSMVAVVLLGGCASPGDGSARSTGAALPSGLVTFTDGRLEVFDVESGRSVDRATLPPDLKPPAITRDTFDAALRRLTYGTCDRVRMNVLVRGSYEPSAEWSPPQEYGQGKQCFGEARFGPDGRIWTTIGATSKNRRRVSLDPEQPESAPRDEGPVTEPQKRTDLRLADPPNTRASVTTDAGRIVRVEVFGPRLDGSVNTVVSDYWCDDRVDDLTFACVTNGPVERQYYGSVPTARVDLAAGTVTMTRFAPSAEPRIGGLYKRKLFPAPDGSVILIRDDMVWFLATVDGGPPQRLALNPPGDPLFWI
jgi:hypothetical protein